MDIAQFGFAVAIEPYQFFCVGKTKMSYQSKLRNLCKICERFLYGIEQAI